MAVCVICCDRSPHFAQLTARVCLKRLGTGQWSRWRFSRRATVSRPALRYVWMHVLHWIILTYPATVYHTWDFRKLPLTNTVVSLNVKVYRLGLNSHIPIYFVSYALFYSNILWSLEHQNSSEQMCWMTSLSLWRRSWPTAMLGTTYTVAQIVIAWQLYVPIGWYIYGKFLTEFGQLYHISLGIVYLHSQNIVHGDLKAVSNVPQLFIVSISHTIIASKTF